MNSVSMQLVMNIPQIPDSAPFTAEQRSWLNGFFASLFSSIGSPQPVVEGGAAEEPVATVAPVENEHPWHDPALAMDERMKLAAGKPTELRLMAAMAQLDCGACGYLCHSYSKAIAEGAESDVTRCAPGGKPTASKLRELVREMRSAGSGTGAVEMKVKGQAVTQNASGRYTRENPYAAKMLESRPLNKPGSGKDTRHVVFDLGDSGLEYKAGDALGVFPENCDELVGRVLSEFKADGNEPVQTPGNDTISLRQSLTSEYAINKIDQDVVDLFARTTSNGEERKTLEKLSEVGPDDMDLLDLLERFPSVRPAASEVVATLKPLRPRLYSISSSPKATLGQVHLTVGYVSYKLHNRSRKGVASTYLADRVSEGKRTRIYVQPSHRFSPPGDLDAPMIMVGPGTGIAPFRAFLQEREATNATGKNWLLFGDQRRQFDYLYQAELELYKSQGLLTRLDTAFSRDQGEKVYVQHRMIEHGAELWKWLEDGAYFYVCGDAKRMAMDVDQALITVVAQYGNMTAEEAKKWVADLATKKRYQRDVY